MIIGERLRTIRENKNITAIDLERRCGISRARISRIENGLSVASLEEIEEIAVALLIPIHELFYDPSQGVPVLEQLSANCHREENFASSKKCSTVLHWVRVQLAKLH